MNDNMNDNNNNESCYDREGEEGGGVFWTVLFNEILPAIDDDSSNGCPKALASINSTHPYSLTPRSPTYKRTVRVLERMKHP